MKIKSAKPPWYDIPMGVFIVGEHIDVHGRRVLYRQTQVLFGDSKVPTTWMRFVKYLYGDCGEIHQQRGVREQ